MLWARPSSPGGFGPGNRIENSGLRTDIDIDGL